MRTVRWLTYVWMMLVAASALAQTCPSDANKDREVTVDEILAGVNAALTGCPPLERLNLTGAWNGTGSSDFGGTVGITAEFQEDGFSVLGTMRVTSECFDDLVIAGLRSGDTFTGIGAGRSNRVAFEATVESRRIRGRYFVLVGGDCSGDSGDINLAR